MWRASWCRNSHKVHSPLNGDDSIMKMGGWLRHINRQKRNREIYQLHTREFPHLTLLYYAWWRFLVTFSGDVLWGDILWDDVLLLGAFCNGWCFVRCHFVRWCFVGVESRRHQPCTGDLYPWDDDENWGTRVFRFYLIPRPYDCVVVFWLAKWQLLGSVCRRRGGGRAGDDFLLPGPGAHAASIPLLVTVYFYTTIQYSLLTLLLQ